MRDVRLRALPVAVCATVIVALAFAFARSGIPAWIPPALLVRAGVASPFSGMTRSVVALARGDVGAAFAWHPLGPVAFLAIAVAAGAAWYSLVTGRRLEPVARAVRSRTLWAVVVVAILAAWVRQILVLEV